MNIVTSQAYSHKEHGYAHGRQQKETILFYLKKWEEKILAPRNLTLAQYANFLHEKKFFKDSILAYCPELFEEVEGIAQGVNIDSQVAFCWQLLDEHSWVLEKYFANPKPLELNACSTLAKRNSYIVLGQNLDIPKYKDGCQTILRQTFLDQSYCDKIIFTQAGALASFGVNTYGICVVVNALNQLAVQEEGLPVSFVIRYLLNSKTIREAEKRIQHIPHATGHHYILCDQNHFSSWECSAHKVLKLNNPSSAHAFHTNHPLQTDDLQPILPPVKHSNTSVARLKLIDTLIHEPEVQPLDQVKKILTTEPVSVRGEHEGLTVFSVIFAYTQNFPTIYYQKTPFSPKDYLKLEF